MTKKSSRPPLKVFYVGDEHHHIKYGMRHTSIYEVSSGEHLYWSHINAYLKNGGVVHLRPANKKELKSVGHNYIPSKNKSTSTLETHKD